MAAARPQDTFVHTTTRQRLREKRREEVRQLYAHNVEPILKTRQVQIPRDFGRTTLKETAALNQNAQPVNHNGQLMDGNNTAIGRAIHGDFYLVHGGSVGEVTNKNEGKAFRCRATPPPVVTLKQSPYQPLNNDKRYNNGLYNKPLVDTPRANANHEHRHHRRIVHHRADCPHYCDNEKGKHHRSHSSHHHRSHHHHHHEEAQAVSAEDQHHLHHHRRPAESKSYKDPTHASKLKENHNIVQQQHPLQRPASAGPPVNRRKEEDPYQTALNNVKREKPGTANMLSMNELDRIRAIAAQPARPASATSGTAKKRKDAERLLY